MKFLKRIIIIGLMILVVGISGKSIAKYFYPLTYWEWVVEYSEQYEIDPYFVFAIIKAESNFNYNAESPKGARGLMQIMPDTAQWAASLMGTEDYSDDKLFQPDFNIKLGCWYLNNLKKEFGDNNKLILAAYNGGRGNVNKWLDNEEYSLDGEELHNIPFGETDKYIKRVEVNYNVYKFLYCQGEFRDILEKIISQYFR
ncbi:lytic transglycosylase domain-containing protein [Clostridium grantii]|uniref:Soluble lytic murein transglycosylase n=1 Tax=Clostridium grantii DSM 8605 TaxID=1121316 RepID=A0A1M5X319_9CLOT|nr:lytic transglycosylase domain-containing protein [Clostridium grantii]SHH94181.1 soluble lytic murein transglycosylase [Clostridium grantii DSM 8605]